MTLLTLFMKVNNTNQLGQIEKTFRSYFKNLDVDEIILGINDADFLQISISGEDEKIASKYLIKNIGLCPENIDFIHKNQIMNGRIIKILQDDMLCVDIGVFKPKIIPAMISLEKLREQLVFDSKLCLKEGIDLFGLNKEVLINIKIINVNKEKNFIKAKLSKNQLSLFDLWRRSLLDRLIIIGASYDEVKKAINHARLNRDVIDIESLSLFDQILSCKLGTDSIGLIPVIGKFLKNTKLAVFNPKKIHKFLKLNPKIGST